LVPDQGLSIVVRPPTSGSGNNSNLVISLDRSIVGGIDSSVSEAKLQVRDSIIDKKSSASLRAITVSGGPDRALLAGYLSRTLAIGPLDIRKFVRSVPNPTELTISGSGHNVGLSLAPGHVKITLDGNPVKVLPVTGAEREARLRLFGPAVKCYEMDIRNSTVFGAVDTVLMDLASNTIFTDTVKVRRVQSGCVRFSYFPDDSRVPRPYKCQPIDSYPEGASEAEKSALAAGLKPRFTSERYGDPGYAELRQDTASEIFQGADNGAEMGAFNYLLAALRLQSLDAALAEYLRFGLEAGAILAT
jgi:hypothetical protein